MANFCHACGSPLAGGSCPSCSAAIAVLPPMPQKLPQQRSAPAAESGSPARRSDRRFARRWFPYAAGVVVGAVAVNAVLTAHAAQRRTNLLEQRLAKATAAVTAS